MAWIQKHTLTQNKQGNVVGEVVELLILGVRIRYRQRQGRGPDGPENQWKSAADRGG